MSVPIGKAEPKCITTVFMRHLLEHSCSLCDIEQEIIKFHFGGPRRTTSDRLSRAAARDRDSLDFRMLIEAVLIGEQKKKIN